LIKSGAGSGAVQSMDQELELPLGTLPFAVCVTALLALQSLVRVGSVMVKVPILLPNPSSAVSSKPNLTTP